MTNIHKAAREALSPNETAKQLQHCAIAVSDWLAGGCDIHDIPRPHIAALVAWAKETTARGEKPVAHLWQHSETGHQRVVMPDQIIPADASWLVVGPLYLAARPEAPSGGRAESQNGWLEAAIAWEVCASIHERFAKGKDALYKTRQRDFAKHAKDSREKAKGEVAPSAPVVALTEEQIDGISRGCYLRQDDATQESARAFALAIIAKFCEVNGIAIGKEGGA